MSDSAINVQAAIVSPSPQRFYLPAQPYYSVFKHSNKASTLQFTFVRAIICIKFSYFEIYCATLPEYWNLCYTFYNSYEFWGFSQFSSTCWNTITFSLWAFFFINFFKNGTFFRCWKLISWVFDESGTNKSAMKKRCRLIFRKMQYLYIFVIKTYFTYHFLLNSSLKNVSQKNKSFLLSFCIICRNKGIHASIQRKKGC